MRNEVCIKKKYCFNLCASYQCFLRQRKISHVDACIQRKSWKYTRAVKCLWFLSQSDSLKIKMFGINLKRATMNSTLRRSVGKPHVPEESDLDCNMPVCNVHYTKSGSDSVKQTLILVTCLSSDFHFCSAPVSANTVTSEIVARRSGSDRSTIQQKQTSFSSSSATREGNVAQYFYFK